MELCGKWILFDKLNHTCSFNRASCFLYWFQSRVVLRAFHRLVASDIHCALFYRSVRGLGWTLPLPLCVNERSWHSHWFCGHLFHYLQPFTCCNKVHWSFLMWCFLCAEPLVAFVALYSSLSLSRSKAKYLLVNSLIDLWHLSFICRRTWTTVQIMDGAGRVNWICWSNVSE